MNLCLQSATIQHIENDTDSTDVVAENDYWRFRVPLGAPLLPNCQVILPLDPAYACALFSKISCWFYVNLRFL
jgi:hypothetical protein